MTNQPDTTAIRAGIFGNPAKVIYDLCDALDAARAEEPRTGWTYADLSHAVDSVEYWKTRAEAAEARHARESAAHARTTAALFDFVERHDQADLDLRALQDRLEAADARIAALAVTSGTHYNDSAETVGDMILALSPCTGNPS